MLSTLVINSLVVSLVVLVHYEFLHQLSQMMPWIQLGHRKRIVLGVGGALVAHAVEVWIFAIAYYIVIRSEGWGHLEGNFDGSLLDCVYFSFTIFTTLGFGDITPHGLLRYLTGIESLTGLVLITWTASFLYIEMQKHWE